MLLTTCKRLQTRQHRPPLFQPLLLNTAALPIPCPGRTSMAASVANGHQQTPQHTLDSDFLHLVDRPESQPVRTYLVLLNYSLPKQTAKLWQQCEQQAMSICTWPLASGSVGSTLTARHERFTLHCLCCPFNRSLFHNLCGRRHQPPARQPAVDAGAARVGSSSCACQVLATGHHWRPGLNPTGELCMGEGLQPSLPQCRCRIHAYPYCP